MLAISKNKVTQLIKKAMGFSRIFQKAKEKLQEAAESGDVNAMNTLGFKYEHGEFDGILQYDLAYKWYKMAADQG